MCRPESTSGILVKQPAGATTGTRGDGAGASAADAREAAGNEEVEEDFIGAPPFSTEPLVLLLPNEYK
jgi:hypothetical protein